MCVNDDGVYAGMLMSVHDDDGRAGLMVCV